MTFGAFLLSHAPALGAWLAIAAAVLWLATFDLDT
jgi:hypothetical protein